MLNNVTTTHSIQTVYNVSIPAHLHTYKLSEIPDFQLSLRANNMQYTFTGHRLLARKYSLEKSMAKPDLVI